MFLSWLILGALIGYVAATKRGFSTVGGVLGGLALGPLAFLMFLVTGVSEDDGHKKCSQCGEWVKAEAKICKHCHQPIAPVATPVTRVRRSHEIGMRKL